MANALNIDIAGKYVVLNPLYYKQPYIIKCTGGFGCNPDTMGNAVGADFLIDGEHARVEGWQILRLATEDEVKNKQISYDDICKLLYKYTTDIQHDNDKYWNMVTYMEDEARSITDVRKWIKEYAYQE